MIDSLAMMVLAATAHVNGLEMYYEIHGKAGANPPLVLLHGGGSTIETSFGATVEELAKHRLVIAFEQQGHGRTTDVADRPFTFEQSADDAAALLEQLGVKQADFFGYSNGGSIAMQIAIRHPKLVRRLVIASAMYKRDGLQPFLWDALQHAKVEDMPAQLREAYLRVAPHPEQLPVMHDKCAKRMLEFKDWPDSMLQSIAAPSLILIGDRDVVRVEHGAEIARLIPNAQLAVLPDTDHMQMCERWPVAMIERFLQ